MGALDKLAVSLGINNDQPNIELAIAIADEKDKKAITEMVGGLRDKNKRVQSNCIKVLYEVGERMPALIAPYTDTFIQLLDSKNNRLQWGAMTALSSVCSLKRKELYGALDKILAIADAGSVITKDHAVRILADLSAEAAYTDNCFHLLNDMLKVCAENQLPMYAEMTLTTIADKHKAKLAKTLQTRLAEVEKESKRKRIEKVIRKLQ